MAGGPRVSIVGLGSTEMGKVYGRTPHEFAVEAVGLALQDAGLTTSDVDGLLISSDTLGSLDLSLQVELGLKNLTIAAEINAFGATAITMVQQASWAIQSGAASTVVCVFATAPLKPGGSAGSAYAAGGKPQASGWRAVLAASGISNPTLRYALAARRHMDTYGTTSEMFGAIAVAQRQWATMNPAAQRRDPISIEDHQSSRMIADPLRLLDCCLVSNGATAIVLTTAARADELRRPPVDVLGIGQCHPGGAQHRDPNFGLVTGAKLSGERALTNAGLRIADIDLFELYDCYTYTVLVTLEDYGLCGKGEGGELVLSGALAPRGSLPVNTGGGQLSSYYMWGMTPLAEAIIQVRGDAAERQVPQHDVGLVSGNGGILDYHGTLVLGSAGTR